jgi:hypothetical protein
MMQQHDCCEGRCATVSVTPLVATAAPIKPRVQEPIVLPMLRSDPAAVKRDTCSRLPQLAGSTPPLFRATVIQLRI